MKTWKTAAPLAGLLLFLTGCGTLLQQGIETLPAPVQDAAWGAVQAWADRRWSLQEPIDAFFAAVDARDAQALKALFSPNVQAADEDLEELFFKVTGCSGKGGPSSVEEVQ